MHVTSSEAAPAPRRERIRDLDALRGLLLVLMTVTHLPTRYNRYSHDLFGFVSSAEGFVFLSAFLSAVPLRARMLDGLRIPAGTFLRRAFRLYRYHMVILCLAFAVASLFTDHRALRNALGFFMDEPGKALLGAALLVYCPPLFDILPMYAVFLAATPLMLRVAQRFGPWVLLSISCALWSVGQLGGREWLQHVAGSAIGGLPRDAFGAFSLLGWQLLWVCALLLGVTPRVTEVATGALPRRVLYAAYGLTFGFLVLRYSVRDIQAYEWSRFFDKWQLGFGRLLNLICLSVVCVQRLRPLVTTWCGRALALLGRHSLFVFSAHLLLCTASTLVVSDPDAGLAKSEEVLLLVFNFVVLWGVAWLRELRKAQGAPAPVRHEFHATRDANV